MRNNKILATAMTTALAGALSAGGVSAGALSVTYQKGTTEQEGRTVATEAIGSNQVIPTLNGGTSCGAGGALVSVSYITGNDFTQNTSVTFQLLEGSDPATQAVFRTTAGPLSGPSNVSPNALTYTSGTSSALIALSGGGEGTNAMTFLIQATGQTIPKESSLTFSFCMDKADLLKEEGQSLSVKVDFSGTKYISEAGGTITVVNAKNGAEGTIGPGVDDGDVKIDVGGEAGSQKFTGSSIDQDEKLTAILGEICLGTNSTSDIFASDLETEWDLNDTTLGSSTTDSIATFKIEDAPLNASIGHVWNPAEPTSPTPEELAGVMVFIDLDGDGEFDNTGTSGTATNDIPASTVTEKGASFDTIMANDLIRIPSQSNTTYVTKTGCAPIIIKAAGNVAINAPKVAPRGTLTINFVGGAQRPFTGYLNFIKRSGTVCTLYNIPGPDSIENANIRVTNKEATQDGTLKGTLRLPTGEAIFEDYDILTAAGLDVIGANQTIYFNTDTLNTIAQSTSNPNGVWTEGWSRAILRLETNLDNVEMMALIRDDDVMGAPLMNMSVGASGNGCGR
jgi:hypothetical protein